ncbi:diguanylate cyclase [Teichococcus vastitatis]|uniref:diguanylate cyclase n=1 Tax=Teichococcus vastitatis TaxID=2307076 RepID=A0ABS9VZD7_9PROT|nr:diguanylate cyclase [Pseudoroseomonas vastitatis]MCI0752278.1 diguanylate cyclase [Pseudoroseomonas vastitatis]
MIESAAMEAETRDALRRMRADGVRRLGERVADLTTAWKTLTLRPWDAVTRTGIGELASVAHRLAGAGGTFGFPALSAAAAPLELVLAGLADSSAPDAERVNQAHKLIASLVAALECGASVLDEPPEPPSATPGEAADPVLVCTADAAQSGLAALVSNLGYAVLRGAAAPPPAQRMAAAVVDAALPQALDTCRVLSARCPVILLADDSSFEARLAAARAGVSAIVPKPLETNELADWLDQFASHRRDATLCILVVDDDSVLAETYAMALRQAGMDASAISDPSRVLDAIAGASPDLVLMDLQMPGIDGIELARVIRQTRRHMSLPLLFLSAEQDAARQIQARRLGGDDFIAKPVDLGRLATLVRLRAERARSLRAVMESDSLTGLLNHGRFKERLSLELHRCRREGGVVSLALLDLDHFKQVNDQHGHLVGDRVIRSLARSLQKRLRRTDVIGRYGGEEFGVLLMGTEAEAARAAIDQVRRRFTALPFETDRSRFTVSFSAGVASNAGPDGPAEAEALIEAADAALYAAKRAGRDCTRLAGEG